MIPHDIRTRWNATYDMLDFVYRYKKAINKITDIWDMKLCMYEIEANEWEIVRQLYDLLKVSKCSDSYQLRTIRLNVFIDFQRCDFIFLMWWHTQHCVSHPCDGPPR
jgi:hypothetical protein